MLNYLIVTKPVQACTGEILHRKNQYSILMRGEENRVFNNIFISAFYGLTDRPTDKIFTEWRSYVR